MSLELSFDDFNRQGQHALFSPSQSSWLRYDSKKVADRVRNQYRSLLGTEIHEYAAMEIELRHKLSSIKSITNGIEHHIYEKYLGLNPDLKSYALKLIKHLGYIPKEVFETVKYYVNDGTGYKMNAEERIEYSDYIFGTSDTVSFRNNFLRIHDLKTGAHSAKMEQLEIYAALYILQHHLKPEELEFELRLYQWDGIVVKNPTAEDILPIIARIKAIDKDAEATDLED